jgi:hypothetical protein
MDAAVKKRWVEALRSGKYKQGKEALARRKPHGKTEYCCLGVLCDVENVLRQSNSFGEFYFGGMEGDPYTGESAYLPREFAEEVGISMDAMQRLAAMNDGTRYDDPTPRTFEEIADYIEKEL